MKKITIELKWAIIVTILTLCWMLLEKTMGWHDEDIAYQQWLTLFFLPFVVFMYVLALREKRRRYYNKKITWKQAFLSGVVMSIFVTLLSPFGQYITHNYITPEYFKNVIDYSVTNNIMTIKKANDYFNINNYMMQAAIGSLVVGILISAVVAIILRRK